MSAALDLLAYVQGPFEHVSDERTDLDLEVIGELPAELHGMFVQNSGNPKHAPRGPYHWFDGDGMVHGVHIEGGKASYRNRWVRTAELEAEDAVGHALSDGILCPVDLNRSPRPDKNTANTDLLWHQGKLLALWWLSGEPYTLTVPGLETVGAEDFGGTLRGGLSAHSKVDPRTKELVFFDYDVYRQPYLRHGVVSPEGRVVHQEVIEVASPSLMHDMAITEHYTVLLDFPMVWDAKLMAQGKRRVRFHTERPSRFGIVPRFGTDADVRWFEASPCYSYHTINAWESKDEPGNTVVTVLACRIENPLPGPGHDGSDGVPSLFFLRLEPYLHEWTFNLGTGEVRERRLDDVMTEFPRANDNYLGVQSRYAFHPRIKRGPTLLFDGCIRYDLQAGTSAVHPWGPHHVGGETVFAPRHGASEEDDGWVVTMVSDLRERTSELVVLDGRDVAAGPVARIRIPRRVPVGFHAHWVPGLEMR
jgi:carotenoid cleavage dioxygenase-like enzyme